jgi:hypothetical protein
MDGGSSQWINKIIELTKSKRLYNKIYFNSNHFFKEPLKWYYGL